MRLFHTDESLPNQYARRCDRVVCFRRVSTISAPREGEPSAWRQATGTRRRNRAVSNEAGTQGGCTGGRRAIRLAVMKGKLAFNHKIVVHRFERAIHDDIRKMLLTTFPSVITFEEWRDGFTDLSAKMEEFAEGRKKTRPIVAK